MSDVKEITYEGKKITVRGWADGKALLMSRDESVKKNLMELRVQYPECVQLLTDPDLDPAPEDLEGVMTAVIDPERVCLLIDFSGNNTGITVVLDPEEEDDE